MNGSQIFVLLFALLVIAMSIGSIVIVVRSAEFSLKPLWIIGCLLGFVGVGVNWTTPDDIVILFGVTIPAVFVFQVIATGQVIVKTGFPFVAAYVLARAGPFRKRGR